MACRIVQVTLTSIALCQKMKAFGASVDQYMERFIDAAVSTMSSDMSTAPSDFMQPDEEYLLLVLGAYAHFSVSNDLSKAIRIAKEYVRSQDAVERARDELSSHIEMQEDCLQKDQKIKSRERAVLILRDAWATHVTVSQRLLAAYGHIGVAEEVKKLSEHVSPYQLSSLRDAIGDQIYGSEASDEGKASMFHRFVK